jgi:hypothetical protein
MRACQPVRARRASGDRGAHRAGASEFLSCCRNKQTDYTVRETGSTVNASKLQTLTRESQPAQTGLGLGKRTGCRSSCVRLHQ